MTSKSSHSSLRRGAAALLVLGLAQAGCGSREAIDSDSGPIALEADTTESAMLGDSGEHVLKINEWLQEFGYFPDEARQREFPAWRPLVAEAPPDMFVFDEHTLAGVKEAQRLANLPQTGVVDSATLGLMEAARCGVPDGVAPLSDSQKFSFINRGPFTTWKFLPSNRNAAPWSMGTCTQTSDCPEAYQECTSNKCVIKSERRISDADAAAAVRTALEAWSADADVTFQETTGAADLEFSWSTCTECGDALAVSYGGSIRFDPTWTWSPTGATGRYDFEYVAIHEIGHELGLGHSSLLPAVMKPSVSTGDKTPTLEMDDKVAAHSMYEDWQGVSGSANDVAVGANGAVWIIGNTSRTGGYNIYKYSGSDWVQATGTEGATRIAVDPSGVPWIVADDGSIYQRSGANAGSGSWQSVSGCAKDIGIGGDGSVWVIGCTAVSGGYRPHKWNGSGWTSANNGGGVRISVGPTGVPWLVNDTDDAYRRSSSSASSGAWAELPGGGAKDIAVGSSGYAWKVSDETASGGYKLYAWNEQPTGGGSPAAPELAEWVSVPGSALHIAAGPDLPWLVNSSKNIYKP